MTSKSKLSVLHVTPWFPPQKGGIATYVSNLYAQLKNQGYRISILTVKKIGESVLNSQGNIYYINCFYLPGWPYSTLKSVSIPLDLGLKIDSYIKKGNFNLIHAHGIHYPITWLSLYFAKKHGIRSILSLHGSYALNPNVVGGETKIEKWLYGHLFSGVMSKAHAVIGPARGVTDFARKDRAWPSTTFYTVEYGLDTKKFASNLRYKGEFRKKYNIDENAIVLLFSGRFEKVKGVLEFCRAAKKIVEESDKRVQAIIMGTGSLKDRVQSILGNTAGVHVFEWQTEENVHQFYIASDIFVIPSRFEGMPITVLEAMNSGLHILYTAVGGIPDILEGYASKTMLKGISDREIYDAIVDLISSNLENYKHEDSLMYARQFDWDMIIQRINSIYDTVLGR